MADYKLTLRDARKYVAAVSGIFYNPDTQLSFSNMEMTVIALLMLDARQGRIVVSPEVKKKIAEMMHISMKSVYNTITRLRRKRVINGTSELHPIFRSAGKVVIEWAAE